MPSQAKPCFVHGLSMHTESMIQRCPRVCALGHRRARRLPIPAFVNRRKDWISSPASNTLFGLTRNASTWIRAMPPLPSFICASPVTTSRRPYIHLVVGQRRQ